MAFNFTGGQREPQCLACVQPLRSSSNDFTLWTVAQREPRSKAPSREREKKRERERERERRESERERKRERERERARELSAHQ